MLESAVEWVSHACFLSAAYVEHFKSVINEIPGQFDAALKEPM